MMRHVDEDLRHLRWIHSRLIKVHGENPNVDYMVKFKALLDELESDKYMEEHHHIADSTIGLATVYLERGNPVAALDILRISQDKLTAITIKYRPLTAEAFGLAQQPAKENNNDLQS
jgi:hypothetical protein